MKHAKGMRGCLRRGAGCALLALVGLFAFFALSLAALRWVNPPTTMVHIQRRAEAVFGHAKYSKQYRFVPMNRISRDFRHAVVAAEDTRFYQHHGIDWVEVENVIDDAAEEGTVSRGASTITQQLVKNLFFTTHRFPVRKVFEFALAPLAEALLSKERILELYLNVIEWGPGVYGAEAAARHHYGIGAAQVSRNQGARLAACIPAPRRRHPQRMDKFSAIIETRMAQMGW